MLTGEIRTRDDVPARRRQHACFAEDTFCHNLALADVVREVATELGVAPGQVAIAWLLAQGDDVVPIPGTKQVDRARSNIRAVDLTLTPEHLARLGSLAASVVGHRAPRPSGIGVEAPPRAGEHHHS